MSSYMGTHDVSLRSARSVTGKEIRMKFYDYILDLKAIKISETFLNMLLIKYLMMLIKKPVTFQLTKH